jgi:hypothetical protein
MREDMEKLYESAARLQGLLGHEDICLVGGSAASYYAEHRVSVDHDHVVRELAERFDAVLAALESEGDWVTNRVKSGVIILGELGGIEAGVRQLIRKTPLEMETVELPSGNFLTIPTRDEIMRIKAILLVKRNQTRDYLDVAALTVRFGTPWAARVLGGMDRYYSDDGEVSDAIASQLVLQLSEPRPADLAKIDLRAYKGVDKQFTVWENIARTCQQMAAALVAGERGE